MPSPLIDRVLSLLVADLVQSGRLLLVDGASQDALTAELSLRIGAAGGFVQAGATLSAALVASPLVDELYASDREIVRFIEASSY